MLQATLNQRTWVLASNNQGKLNEFQHIFAVENLPIRVYPQAYFEIPDAVENGLSFVENAMIKARHAAKWSGLPALADDSGLSVPTLGGMPGIYSARYAGEHGHDALNNQKLLNDLQPHRGDTPIVGFFVCVLVFVRHWQDPLPIIAQGVWQGEILTAPIGEQGFGYDPLFWLPHMGCSSAQLDKGQKNAISHRGLAMQQLLLQLKQCDI